MKTLKFVIIGSLLVTAVACPIWLHKRAKAGLRPITDKYQLQARLLAELAAENERLSNAIAQAKNSQALSQGDFLELLRLRNEVRQLRWALKGIAQLQSEMRRMRDALNDLAKEKERGGAAASALLTDKLEQELRTERVAHLKEWLKESPSEERTPELQFVPEDWWVRSADWPHVTDEDYQVWMSAARAGGELKFASMAFDALKQYTKANNGQFPSDVSQLKPYFTSPIDDAILQRYHVVPAKSLTKFFADVGGDWVITQKAPVNKKFDVRIAIGLTDVHGGGGEGRWDPVQ